MLLFAVYFILMFGLFYFLKRKTYKKFSFKIFSFSVLSIYAAGLLFHLYLINKLNLSLGDYFVIGNNGTISSNVITHIHTAKGFIGEVLRLIGIGISNADAGIAYPGILSEPLLFAGSLLLIFVLLLAVIFFVYKVVPFVSSLSDNKRKFFLILGYIVLSFCLIKTSVDGGVLSPPFIVSIAMSAIFYLRELRKREVRIYYDICLVFSILMLVLSLSPFASVTILAGGVSSLVLLYLLILVLTDKEFYKLIFWATLVAFSLSWWQAGLRDRDILEYQNQVIGPDDTVYVYSREEGGVKKIAIESETTIKKLAQESHVNITYMPVAVEWKTCLPTAPAVSYKADIVTNSEVKDSEMIKPSFLRIVFGEGIKTGEYWLYHANILMDQCLPEPMSLINAYIIARGVQTYALINPEFND